MTVAAATDVVAAVDVAAAVASVAFPVAGYRGVKLM